MRLFLRVCMLGVLASAVSGCGGSSMDEGVPKAVDMTKDYSPKAEMPGMSPKQSSEANKKSAASAAPTTK